MGVSVGSKKTGGGSAAIGVTDIQDPKQLDALAKKLLNFALRFASLQRWWLGDGGALAKGNQIEDVVRAALVRLYGGKHRWDPTKYPDPWVYLKLVVKTELLNLAKSAENRRGGRDIDDDTIVSHETPESLLLQAEEDAARPARVAHAYSLLIDELGDDAQLIQLHDLIINEGIDKPKQLAERLGLPVKEVYNLQKRFRRACRRVLAILEKEQNQ